MVDPKAFPGGDAFVEFIQDRKILIADSSSVTRSSLARILNDLGVKGGQISLVSTMEQALEEIPRFRPHVVVAEFDLGKRCGLDLIQLQRETHPEQARECIFIIVAGNTSQSAVARAAEEDVDAYIVKP
ncbi:MAG: response regulator [Deltaproteobacteria bacterium]|nr:response regulator [Deltaproteobacteria bacterium]